MGQVGLRRMRIWSEAWGQEGPGWLLASQLGIDPNVPFAASVQVLCFPCLWHRAVAVFGWVQNVTPDRTHAHIAVTYNQASCPSPASLGRARRPSSQDRP